MYWNSTFTLVYMFIFDLINQFVYFSVIICSSCFWSEIPESANPVYFCDSPMTLTPKATSAPSEWISRSGPLNWMAKLSSCKFGTPPDRNGLEQSHPGTHWDLVAQKLLLEQLILWAFCCFSDWSRNSLRSDFTCFALVFTFYSLC